MNSAELKAEQIVSRWYSLSRGMHIENVVCLKMIKSAIMSALIQEGTEEPVAEKNDD